MPYLSASTLSVTITEPQDWRCWIRQATTTYTITLLLILLHTFFQIRKRIQARDTLTNEDLQYAGITPLQACIRTTERHDHSVDDDLFDLGLGCQMD